jgi:hypothetical protein
VNSPPAAVRPPSFARSTLALAARESGVLTDGRRVIPAENEREAATFGGNSGEIKVRRAEEEEEEEEVLSSRIFYVPLEKRERGKLWFGRRRRKKNMQCQKNFKTAACATQVIRAASYHFVFRLRTWLWRTCSSASCPLCKISLPPPSLFTQSLFMIMYCFSLVCRVAMWPICRPFCRFWPKGKDAGRMECYD